ncbi:MAG TPA: Crp/Fnr family transcriptional regulator [Thiobacillaceae bacterium]|nr:Crp/Fnr family transcriptional regulator [Thiobacillaceae bacterium]
MTLTQDELLALRRCYLFSGLDEQDFRDAVSRAGPVSLTAGQSLFVQDQPVTAFYYVLHGLIRLYRTSPVGDEKVIELIGPGRFFAEAALFMGGRYPVNAMAQADSRLIAIDGPAFKTWLIQDANRCVRLLAATSARLHKMVNEIDRLTLMKGADRLLQYLLDHADPDESGRQVVDLEAPKQVIASRIGVKPETFSRLLHKLSDLGYLEVQGNRVYIKEGDDLRDARVE